MHVQQCPYALPNDGVIIDNENGGLPHIKCACLLSGSFQVDLYKAGELKTLDVETGGDKMAREIGRYVLTIQQGSETTNIAGKYVVIWKQENGEWKLDVDIWNS